MHYMRPCIPFCSMRWSVRRLAHSLTDPFPFKSTGIRFSRSTNDKLRDLFLGKSSMKSMVTFLHSLIGQAEWAKLHIQFLSRERKVIYMIRYNHFTYPNIFPSFHITTPAIDFSGCYRSLNRTYCRLKNHNRNCRGHINLAISIWQTNIAAGKRTASKNEIKERNARCAHKHQYRDWCLLTLSEHKWMSRSAPMYGPKDDKIHSLHGMHHYFFFWIKK